MRKIEWGIPAIALLGLLFWLLFLRPAFLRPHVEAAQAMVERLLR